MVLMDAILQYCRPRAVPRCFLDRCDDSGIEEVSGYPWGEHDNVLVSPRPTLRMGRLTHLRYTRRERRHLARHGRRWPIRVPAYQAARQPRDASNGNGGAQARGHRRWCAGDRAALPPVGQSVTDAHLRAVAGKVSGEWLRSGDVRP